MRQVGKVYKRTDKAWGWWLRWTDPVTHKRMTKSFHTKGYADHFRQMLYYQLNSDIFTGTINVSLQTAVKEFLENYSVRGMAESSKVQAEIAMRHFTDFTGESIGTKYLQQKHFDLYVKSRINTNLSRFTVNKDIRYITAFLHWACDKRRRYVSSDIEVVKLKVQPPAVKALNTEQIQALFKACPTMAWRIRLLLSLVTGLRSSDIDNLKRASIDLKRSTIDTESQKTGKGYPNRPLPQKAIPELTGYLNGLPEKQVQLFEDKNIRKSWQKIGNGITRQDLRKTFATMIQSISGTETARDLLEHYSSKITEDFYTDKELLNRIRVNRLPVKKWLQ